MVAEHCMHTQELRHCCSLAKISMVAEQINVFINGLLRCSLAKISMVAEPDVDIIIFEECCSLAKISMVAELVAY